MQRSQVLMIPGNCRFPFRIRSQRYLVILRVVTPVQFWCKEQHFVLRGHVCSPFRKKLPCWRSRQQLLHEDYPFDRDDYFFVPIARKRSTAALGPNSSYSKKGRISQSLSPP